MKIMSYFRHMECEMLVGISNIEVFYVVKSEGLI